MSASESRCGLLGWIGNPNDLADDLAALHYQNLIASNPNNFIGISVDHFLYPPKVGSDRGVGISLFYKDTIPLLNCEERRSVKDPGVLPHPWCQRIALDHLEINDTSSITKCNT